MPFSSWAGNIGKFLEGDVGKSILAGIQAAAQARPQGQFIDLGHGYRAWREPGRGESLSNMMGAFAGAGAGKLATLKEENEKRLRELQETAAEAGLEVSPGTDYRTLLAELSKKVAADRDTSRLLPLRVRIAELGQIPQGTDLGGLSADLAGAVNVRDAKRREEDERQRMIRDSEREFEAEQRQRDVKSQAEIARHDSAIARMQSQAAQEEANILRAWQEEENRKQQSLLEERDAKQQLRKGIIELGGTLPKQEASIQEHEEAYAKAQANRMAQTLAALGTKQLTGLSAENAKLRTTLGDSAADVLSRIFDEAAAKSANQGLHLNGSP